MIRIGTRKSPLALWQAQQVQAKLTALGYPSELVLITSDGDKNRSQPIYEMGISGVFTKALDIALINNEIDIAVHSMKDVPTVLATGLEQIAVLERGSFEDVLITHHSLPITHYPSPKIATSSLRRRAQWLHRYPLSKMHDIRGNIGTRLKKLETEGYDGIILAKAGLERIGLLPDNHIVLDWMIPAPAQGAIVIIASEAKQSFDSSSTLSLKQIFQTINHIETHIETYIERHFMRAIQAGCTMPVAALARVLKKQIHLKVGIYLPDGSEIFESEDMFLSEHYENIGLEMADRVLKNEKAFNIIKKLRQTI